ncbi:phage tail protein [Peptostreptococcaceae bacterium AGR-M142]
MQKDYPFFYINLKESKEDNLKNLIAYEDGVSLEKEKEFNLKDIVDIKEAYNITNIKEIFFKSSKEFYVINSNNDLYKLNISNFEKTKINSLYKNYLDNIDFMVFDDYKNIFLNDDILYFFSNQNSQLIREIDFKKDGYHIVSLKEVNGHILMLALKDFLIKKDLSNNNIFFSNKQTSLYLISLDSEKGPYKSIEIPFEFEDGQISKFENVIAFENRILFKNIYKSEIIEYYMDQDKILKKSFSKEIKDFYIDVKKDIYTLFYDNAQEADKIENIYNGKSLNFYYGKIDKLYGNLSNQIFAMDFKDNKILIFEKMTRLKRYKEKERVYGYYISNPIDSHKENNKWHKIRLDANIPKNTQIKIKYALFEDYYQACDFKNEEEDNMEKFFSGRIVNSKDALFYKGQGRYMVLKIEFYAGERQSPSINDIKIYYNREGYLKYLPEIYRTSMGDDFLERFLAIFETFLMDMEENISNIYEYFNPHVVDEDFLGFLADMMGIKYDFNISQQKLRYLIRNIGEIYSKRGTKEGIKKLLEIILNDDVYIIESFKLENEFQNPYLKKLYKKLYSNNPYSFTILVKEKEDFDSNDWDKLKIILNKEKPAYTNCNLVVLKPWIYLDKHSYLQINSKLSTWNKLKLNDKTIIPFDTLLNKDDVRLGINSYTGMILE